MSVSIASGIQVGSPAPSRSSPRELPVHIDLILLVHYACSLQDIATRMNLMPKERLVLTRLAVLSSNAQELIFFSSLTHTPSLHTRCTLLFLADAVPVLTGHRR